MAKLEADVLVVGAGLAGLVAACEAYNAGHSVLILDQEPEASLGGQAFWSFGGLFLVDTPEQRRLGVHDSEDLAYADWVGSAQFDRDQDHWAKQWARAYVHFAATEKRSWLRSLGVKFFPLVQWAERGGYDGQFHGNSVPRFHVTWGTGPGVLEPFLAKIAEGRAAGKVTFAFRHRATSLVFDGGALTGVEGSVLAPSRAARGVASSREVTEDFSARAQAVIIATGGMGGNHAAVREQWPNGRGPAEMISGVPASVDGDFQQVAAHAGASLINTDRMWHYPEGIKNWDPVWPMHGIRILPGPSSLWLDAHGKRLPTPLFPGYDALGALRHIVGTGYSHSWFVLNRRIIGKEFALSGSEQNPDLTGKSVKEVLGRARVDVPGPVQAFLDHGEDFIQARSVPELTAGMNALTGSELIDPAALDALVKVRDTQVRSGLGKDMQINAIREARRFRTDKLIRVVSPKPLEDPADGPLIAVRLSVLTRKSLGGLATDLSSRVLDHDGAPIPGLYAAGEVAGFGGGGVHGYRALEGTFLGGCLFSGRTAGRAVAAALSKK